MDFEDEIFPIDSRLRYKCEFGFVLKELRSSTVCSKNSKNFSDLMWNPPLESIFCVGKPNVFDFKMIFYRVVPLLFCAFEHFQVHELILTPRDILLLVRAF